MQKATAHWLHRTFWSAYGRAAWDKQREPWREAQIDSVVSIVMSAVEIEIAQVLDVGCGTGRYAEALARAGLSVRGIDYADGMVELASTKCADFPDGQLQFQQADLNDPLPFEPDMFDAAICVSVLQAVDDPNAVLEEIGRVLKPGGTLVLVLPLTRKARSLSELTMERLGNMPRKGFGTVAMVIAKSMGEKLFPQKTWTSDEAEDLVTAAGFDVAESDSRYQLRLACRKP